MEVKELKKPPKQITSVFSGKVLSKAFAEIVGMHFKLTGKSRTDGANIRKIISNALSNKGKIELAEDDSYEIPSKKGIPKLLAQCIDSYIVTSGKSYNLQIWNRFPTANTALVKYKNGDVITAKDIRFVFVKINLQKSIIDSVVIASPSFIETNFGKFGVPTMKHQLIISDKLREKINSLEPPILFETDTMAVKKIALSKKIKKQSASIKDEPESESLYELEVIKDSLSARILGMKIPTLQTKNKGQMIEKEVMESLGYEVNAGGLMEGNYPDIRHQLLEIKVQDSPTVDLGKYSPVLEEKGFCKLNVTSSDVRYFIAMVNKENYTISSLVIMPGKELLNHFSHVRGSSFKCQRAIPMEFFNSYSGKSVFLG